MRMKILRCSTSQRTCSATVTAPATPIWWMLCGLSGGQGEYDPHAEKRFAPALCNRLDRGTEGLVLAAKSYAALRDLNAIIRDDMMKKEYLTITVGAPPQGAVRRMAAAQREKITRCASTPVRARVTSRSSPR